MTNCAPSVRHKFLNGTRRRPSVACAAWLIVISVLHPTDGAAQREQAVQTSAGLAAEYLVEIRDTATHTFHVRATFMNVPKPYLDVALPSWTPGAYSIQNYARNVRRFTVTAASGATRYAARVGLQRWRIDTRGTDHVTIEFDYVANVLASNEAKITSDFAFFTGTQLFLEPVGHRQAHSTVRFVVPDGWRVVSALRDATAPTVYTARSYDELVDAPTVLGRFDVARFDVDGKPHLFVTTPAGAFDSSSVSAFIRRLPALIQTQRAIFGSLPYDKYVFFYSALDSEGTAPGGLEHGNSFVALGQDPATVSETSGLSFLAHEFFHLWNVKRIRPAELWPYDYSQPNLTPSLWVAEGVTSYYADLTVYRAAVAGIPEPPRESRAIQARYDTTSFLQQIGTAIASVEQNEARHHASPADASMAAFGGSSFTNYYQYGNVLGALLDLSILRDSDRRSRLDDVMRILYSDYYQGGRGFTPDDLIRVVNRVAGRDYGDFFRRYVSGVEVPPYDSILGYAGYRASRTSRRLASIPGLVNADSVTLGRHVNIVRDGSPAASAGIRRGDIIVSIDGVPVHQLPLARRAGRYWIGGTFVGRGGERVTLRFQRAGEELERSITLGMLEALTVRVESLVAPTAQQLAVRSAWLRR